MTYPRSQLVPPGSPGVYHCVSRCVRRAFLCGDDRYNGQSFEHRRQWIEDRLHQLAEVFAVSLWAYAVMSNHLHVVVQVLPEAAAQWTDEEVAERWIRLFPKADQDNGVRAQMLLANPERLTVLRSRLSDLSWFMRCLSEPIARRANAEDHRSIGHPRFRIFLHGNAPFADRPVVATASCCSHDVSAKPTRPPPDDEASDTHGSEFSYTATRRLLTDPP